MYTITTATVLELGAKRKPTWAMIEALAEVGKSDADIKMVAIV
jgi:hypothetical protein